MSMKRSKQPTGSRRSEYTPSERSPLDKPPPPEKTYDELVAGQPDQAFLPYDMKRRYEIGAFVDHVKFGRGAVIAVDTGHIEVVFADQKRKLGHARP